jgi:signal transduction histidine kinase
MKTTTEIFWERYNYSEAFYYQERLLKYISAQNTIKSQAAIFEKDQNSKLIAKDLAISKLNEEKAKTNLWGTIIFFILLISILYLYFRARKNKLKQNLLFEQINVLTETQVNQIQLAEAQAKDAERKKMGQELHDDLAGSLASLKLELENESEKIKDETLHIKLKELTKNANDAYQIARGKSHEWFDLNSENKGFANIINELLDKGLPADQYEKEVSIENNAIVNFSKDTMVELIYITKEALTNILKYAKANKISLLIYEEIDKIIYEIADNGRGFDTQNDKEGLGIKSMKNRVNKLHGTFKIFSYNVGTEIQITIPKKI